MNWLTDNFNFAFGDFAKAFLSVLFEGVPFLLLGSIISGLVDVFVSSERVTKMLPRKPGPAIFMAGLLGLIFPMCECGSVIIVRRFIRKGVPVAVAMTYMLAAPIVSPIVALSTYKAFSGQQPELMVALRLGFGFLIAVAFGLIVHQLPWRRILQRGIMPDDLPVRRTGLSIAGAPGDAPDFSEIVAATSPLRRLVLAVQSATADFLDVAFYFVIGAGITSVFAVGINQEALAPLAEGQPLLSVITLMIVAALLALCSTTDAFVAATQFVPFSAASKLAFLLFGPVFDLKLFWLYGLIFKRRFVIIFSIALFVLIALICWIFAGVDAGPKAREATQSLGSIGCLLFDTRL